MSGSFSAFKLHSNYTPNPTINISPSPSAPEITPNLHCICAHCSNLFSFNIHHRLGEEEEGITITSSSRWNPTPAQLLYLEQLYRQGTKTPTAQQIQLIASQLRRFGNIQAKNVFYWFQNHKARDRQKRRRSDMEISPPPPPPAALQHASQGLRGTGYEVKETNKWASSSNCSALAEVSDSLNRAERGAYRRTQREERETQILRIKREESLQAKCQIRDHMSSFFLSNSKHLNIKSSTTSNPTNYYCYDDDEEEEEVADDRTLKLFPLKRSDEDDESSKDKDKFCSFNKASMDSDEITSNKFFEFLPLRN